MSEFSLEGVTLHQFLMKGRDICQMGKESFLALTPPFVGDILWEHLEILQKGKRENQPFLLAFSSALPTTGIQEYVCKWITRDDMDIT